jgi:hypothetical protein
MNLDDNLFAPDADVPPAAQGWVLCEFGNVALAIPRSDVLSIEQGSELAAALHDERAAGWFVGATGPWPAYALDDGLQPTRLHGDCGFIAFLRADPVPLGLLCNNVRIIGRDDELPMQALPAPLAASMPAVEAVARLSPKRLAYVFGAGAATPFLTRLMREEGSRYAH